LDARVMDALRGLPAPARRLSWPSFPAISSGRQRLAFASAALCLFVAGFLLGHGFAGGNRHASLTGQQQALPMLPFPRLISDHHKYLSDRQPAQIASSDPSHIARAMTPLVSFPVAPVDLTREGARLLGGRRCLVRGVPVAFLLYEWRGRRISLFQTDHRKITVPGLHEALMDGECYLIGERDGLGYVVWCSGRSDFVMVARAAPGELLRLASHASGATMRG
jgi:anti-sigma factor RsiW